MAYLWLSKFVQHCFQMKYWEYFIKINNKSHVKGMMKNKRTRALDTVSEARTSVKSMKRLLTDNIGNNGNLNNDSFATVLLNYGNTPDHDTGLSPSQILFARQLRDSIPTRPQNLMIRKEWILTRDAMVKALSVRHKKRRNSCLSTPNHRFSSK